MSGRRGPTKIVGVGHRMVILGAACQASVDLFGLTKDDFIPQVQDVITVGEFYGFAAGGQIIFS